MVPAYRHAGAKEALNRISFHSDPIIDHTNEVLYVPIEAVVSVRAGRRPKTEHTTAVPI